MVVLAAAAAAATASASTTSTAVGRCAATSVPLIAAVAASVITGSSALPAIRMDIGRPVIAPIPSWSSSTVPSTVIEPYTTAVDFSVAPSATQTNTSCRAELNGSKDHWESFE
jgi:hypothetical protein